MRRKTIFLLVGILTLLIASCDVLSDFFIVATPTATPSTGEGYTVDLIYEGPNFSNYKVVYAAWIEDEDGKNLQNLFVCNSVLGIGKTLTGTALPYWKTKKYPDSDVDGISGATVQGSKTISSDLLTAGVTLFRVCFEIDRSLNGNDYYSDRPSFIYKSDIIDLSALSAFYDLVLEASMPNNTLSGPYSQAPKVSGTVPGFAAWAYLTELEYIAPVDEMVSMLRVTLSAK